MTDYLRTKKRIEKVCKRWHNCLGLSWWRINHRWYEKCDESDPEVAARTMARWEYREATIDWYAEAWAYMTDEQLEDRVVHELTHIILSPLYEALAVGRDRNKYKINEFTTEMVKNALIWTRSAGVNDAKV